jgi:hypothetical protein
MLDFAEIDGLARAGYAFSAGHGRMPNLIDQLSIDAFNAGVSNYNIRRGQKAPKVMESSRKHQDGTNTAQSSDKSLAIICNH